MGVAAGPDQILIGPARLSKIAAHDIELDLAAIEQGERQIVEDEDGPPHRLV